MIYKNQFRNFDLLAIRYPFTAIISLLHRVSGVFTFLFLPFLLWIFSIATGSKAGFAQIRDILTNPSLKFILWLLWVALWYHLIAGMRHIIMDIGVGESLGSARLSGVITIIITSILAICTGIWLW